MKTLLSLFLITAQAGATEIVSFNPTGSVKNVQQVAARFSADMAPMGDARASNAPFTIKCKTTKSEKEDDETPAHSSAWADSRNWTLSFNKPLKAGVRCTFSLVESLKDLKGDAVTGREDYSFSTAGPAILALIPDDDSIEADQYFIAKTDGGLDPKSVEKGAYFEVEGLSEKIGLEVVTGSERETVIKFNVENGWQLREYRDLLKQKKSIARTSEFDDLLVLRAVRRFPEGKKVVLHWTKNIVSKSGVAVEDAQSFTLKVKDPFKADFNCTRTAPERPCNPVLDMSLYFNRPVAKNALKDAKLIGPGGKTWTPTEFKKPERNETSVLTFEGPFPEKSKFKIHLPALKDDLNGKLSNQGKFPLEVATDEHSPLIKFPAPFGILELNADPVLPVSLRNVERKLPAKRTAIAGKTLNVKDAEQIVKWYREVQRRDYDSDARNVSLIPSANKFEIAKPLGERELELIGIPLKKPGFYVVELESPRLGEALTGKKPMFVSTSALVTNMAVHFKKGRESSLVWVTQLSNAKPVAGAQVFLTNGKGKELARGVTAADGTMKLKALNFKCAEGEYECEYFVFAQKGEDVSFVSTEWQKGIESYRFQIYPDYQNDTWGPAAMHTILDRTVAKPGDTINMKHILRERASLGFRMMNAKRLPRRVLVEHAESRKTFTLPFAFDKKSGSATGKFTLPKDATLGTYHVRLSNKDKMPKTENAEADPTDWQSQITASFVVGEYRLPLMKATIKIQDGNLIAATQVKADLSAAYLSGGPAKGLKTKVLANLSPSYFSPDVAGASDFRFYSDPVKPGTQERDENEREKFLDVQDIALGDDGGKLATIKRIPKSHSVQNLTVEMEYADPNGEIKTTTASTKLFPSAFAVGLRIDGWVSAPGKTKVEGVVVDTEGTAKGGRPFTVEAFKSIHYSHRKRLVGGFYSYDHKTEIVALGKVCEGKSDARGRFACEPKKLPPGHIILQARTVDEKKRPTFARVGVSVYEEGSDSWWTPTDSDRIDLIPEKLRYEPGEKAKFEVRLPYPSATVLVTVEREGVLDSFVREVRRDQPTIEVPLKGHYAPNVFVSALVLRGRVGEPKPTALLDLGRPSMKMGLAEIKVGWKDHELKVSVKTDKRKYKTREKAQVEIEVKAASGAKLPAGTEVVVAAVDEALLRLKENRTWNILEAMMSARGLAVSTSTGQNQVVGKRHFGAKAKPAGGGGGDMNDTRTMFEPVLMWSPRVKVGANGKAKVVIPLNDSMTSFRIVGVATSGVGHFGSGSTTIAATKDLIIYSGFAPRVREGDRIVNSFTVRNTTEKPMKVVWTVRAKGVLTGAGKMPAVELKPSEARVIDVQMEIPKGLNEIDFHIAVTDGLSGASDSMAFKTPVAPAVPERVQQATLFQLAKAHSIPVKQPAGAIPDSGGLRISARPSLVMGLAGVRAYMEEYPYTCLEQKLSRAIVAEDKKQIQTVVELLPQYFDSFGLVKFFSNARCGSDQLTRYVLNILEANGQPIPASTRERMVGGLQSVVNGRYRCTNWFDSLMPKKYDHQEKILLFESLSRYKAFDPKMLATVKIAPNLWASETVVAWHQLLKRQTDIPDRDAQLKTAATILRSRVNFQGSLMNLQNAVAQEAQWMLFTSRDQEAMGVFGVLIDDPSAGEDAGRMARGIVARLKLGHWDTTPANAWGVTMLRRFSAKHEKEKVAGVTKVNEALSFDWTKAPNGERKVMTWPKTSEVKFAHAGSGKPWVHFETLSAVPLKTPVDMGYSVSRKISPVVQKTKGKWSVGDVVNVELTVTAKADQPWVVVRDPIPSGASHLGTGLDGESRLLDQGPQGEWPTEFEEKSHAELISYAAYLPRGTYRLNYRIRLNSDGEFKLPPTRVEAMYSPETFGEAPNATWKMGR